MCIKMEINSNKNDVLRQFFTPERFIMLQLNANKDNAQQSTNTLTVTHNKHH